MDKKFEQKFLDKGHKMFQDLVNTSKGRSQQDVIRSLLTEREALVMVGMVANSIEELEPDCPIDSMLFDLVTTGLIVGLYFMKYKDGYASEAN